MKPDTIPDTARTMMDAPAQHRVTVFPTTPTHKPSSSILGCHLDAYGHQLRALSSQLLLDGSFESEQSNGSSSLLTPWTVTAPAGTVGLDAVHKMHGKKSMRFATRAGVGASIANRGQFGHGLALEATRSYEVSFFALAAAPSNVRVALVDWLSNRTLTAATVRIAASADFARFSLSLPPTAAGTSCVGRDGACSTGALSGCDASR